ncbi:MAG: AraC family transcriptional regulator [Eubacteriales bacterium]|nr:AraC family transcriptional regulator [Eubacteriales bacterium]
MPIHFLSAPLREPLSFDSVGAHWVQEHVVRPDGYPRYHYLMTEQGCGQLRLPGRTLRLAEGEGVLLAPQIPHSYEKESPQWITAFATFTGVLESSIGAFTGGRSIVMTDKEQGNGIASLLSRIDGQFRNPPVDPHTLSVDCYRLLLLISSGSQSKDPSEDPLYIRYIAPVIREIETHYGEPLTAAQLARLVYVSPQYLSRLFHRFLGCSVYEYLSAYRLGQAKTLLLTRPRMAVQEIAARTGFPDASHFTAVFRKAAGVTPREFRKLG